MTSREPLIRLVAWWLVASILTAVYAGISLLLGGTPPWMDVTLGAVIILALVRWTAQPDLWLIKRQDHWLGWIILVLAALLGLSWASPSFVSARANRFPLSLIYLLRQLPVAIGSEPALRLSEAYQAGDELPLDALVQLALACLALGMVALATAGGLRAVWMSLQPVLSPPLDALRARLPRLTIRPGRWLARLRRLTLLLLTGLALGSVITGLAAVANLRLPQVGWRTKTIDQDWQALVIDDRDGTLYAVTTDGGVLRSSDDGASWKPADDDLASATVRALALDLQDNALYAGTEDSVFRSADDGASWQAISPSFLTYPWRDLLSAQRGYGLVAHGRGPEDPPVWATYGGGAFWVRLVASLGLHQATIRPQPEGQDAAMGPSPATSPLIPVTAPDGKDKLIAAWGDTLGQAELEPGYSRIPLAWLALRAWVWQTGALWPILLALPPLLTGALALAFTYANLARPFGVPLWATLLARRRLDTYVRPAVLEAAWPDWEQAIRTELSRYGDVTVDDLSRMPGAFRRYALHRYAQTYGPTLALEAHPGRLRLLTGSRLRRWHAAWATAARSIGTQTGPAPPVPSTAEGSTAGGITATGRKAIDALAAVLAETLGLTLDQPRDFEAARACLVKAPALRLRLPPRFPLIFIADPQPGAHTVPTLMDTVDALRGTGYFALVVPLEPRVRQLDVASELRQAVDRSPHLQDFIVLSQRDVLDILSARHPTQALVQRILAQVDLTVVSPFVISGPVPEAVFFGREAEVKVLVESAGSADFAIVGNRKIGKTSLLQRVQARMAAGRRARPLTVDCQIVRDATGFFAAFQAQNKLTLPSPTPEGLTAALTELRQDEPPPVLLMDEVDELLADEKARGEPLVATWRALAQAGVCRFIFCGSTELARRLDDPGSAFFNFPQPLPLGYLSPETARLVLSQPLETLGIVLEDAETLLAEVQALTSGHPNLIQYLGRGLVQAANRRGERRVLLDDLAALRDSTDFTEYYLKTVWGRAGSLARLITLLVPPDGFQLGELETALAELDVQVNEEQLDTTLKLLRIYAILEKRGRTYTFVPRAFPEILHRTQEVERLITIEKRRLTTGGI